MRAIRRRRLETRQENLRVKLKEAEMAGDEGRVSSILMEITEIRQKIIELSGSHSCPGRHDGI